MNDETAHIARAAAALDDPYASLNQHLHGDVSNSDSMRAKIQVLIDAAKSLLLRDQCNTCPHEYTYRAGAIWEVCEDCGARWADDTGGKPEWKPPAEWLRIREAIAALEVERD